MAICAQNGFELKPKKKHAEVDQDVLLQNLRPVLADLSEKLLVHIRQGVDDVSKLSTTGCRVRMDFLLAHDGERNHVCSHLSFVLCSRSRY